MLYDSKVNCYSYGKGFTVKAKSPVKKSAPEWDYDKAKEMVRGKAIVFCLPGRGCSYAYLKNFVQLCFDLVQAGASIQDLAGLFVHG